MRYKGHVIFIIVCTALLLMIPMTKQQQDLHADGSNATAFYCSNNEANPNTCFFSIAFENDEQGNPTDTSLAMQQAIETYQNDPDRVLPNEDNILLKLLIDDEKRNSITIQDLQAIARMGSSLHTALQKEIIMANPQLDLTRFQLHSKESGSLPAQTFQEDSLFEGYSKVLFPIGITTIEENAFSGTYTHENLTLVFPSTMNEIAQGAFAGDVLIPYNIEFTGEVSSFLANIAKANIKRLTIHGDANPNLTMLTSHPLKDSKILELDATGATPSSNTLDLNTLYDLNDGETNTIALKKLIATEGYESIKATGFANLEEVEIGGSALSELDLQHNQIKTITGLSTIDSSVHININKNAIDFTNAFNHAFYDMHKTNANYQMSNQRALLQIEVPSTVLDVSSIAEIIFEEPTFIYQDKSTVNFTQPKEWMDPTYLNEFKNNTTIQFFDATHQPIAKSDIDSNGTYYAAYSYNNQRISDYITIQYEESTVEKTATTLTIETLANQVMDTNTEIKFDIQLTKEDSLAFPQDSSVKIKIDGVEVDDVTLLEGRAELKHKFSEGTHRIQAIYDGNETYMASTSQEVSITISQTTDKKIANIIVSSDANDRTTSDDTITLSAELETDESDDMNANATITFEIDGVRAYTAVPINNKVQYMSKLPQGSHEIQVIYSGNDIYDSTTSDVLNLDVKQGEGTSTNKITPVILLTVSKSSTKYYEDDEITYKAQMITITDSDVNKQATIMFKIDGKTVTSKALQNGMATYTTKHSAGKHEIMAVYSGNENFHTVSSSPLQMTILNVDEVENAALLKSLTLSSGVLSPSFQPTKNQYTASVGNKDDVIYITAIAEDPKAVVSGDKGIVNLNVGLNELKIKVKNGTKETNYSIHITRKEAVDKPSFEVKSEDGSIIVLGDFDDSYKIKTEPLEDVQLQDTYAKDYSLVHTFDIYMTKNGERIPLNQNVEVRIQREDAWPSGTDGVMYIGDDGEIELMPSQSYDSYISFTTNHFSTYAVYTKNTIDVQDNIQTGSTVNPQIYGYAILLSMIILTITWKKKRQTKL